MPDASCGGCAIVGHVKGVRVLIRLDASFEILENEGVKKCWMKKNIRIEI